MASNLTQRILFALIALPIALVLVWYGGAPLALLVAIAGVLGTRELIGFARRQGMRPLAPAMLATAAGLPALAWAANVGSGARELVDLWWPYAGAAWLILVLVATLARVAPNQRPLGSAAVTIFAPLYAAGLPAFLLTVRHSQHGGRSLPGAALVLFPLVTVWICDTVAMIVGRRLGGPKLAPTVSPGKTWSGTIGGFIGALAVGPVYRAAVFVPLGLNVSPWQALVMAAVIGSLGQVGDLAESLLKREVGLKDSSRLIPGHGGVLDRLDSLYFAIPLGAGLYRLFGVI
ncbi:MAG TPA: phosphatidate cytidylyltransferase [Gemmatimonadales bacterium]